MTHAYIALGANLGEAQATIREVIAALTKIPHSRVLAVSSLYRTAPIGLVDQPDFINAVVLIATELNAATLLNTLFTIEQDFGRQRSVPNAPRTLDLDLLLHGDSISNAVELTLPHPRMYDRAFVLAPLAEIAPGLEIPAHGKVETLLANCADQRIERLPS